MLGDYESSGDDERPEKIDEEEIPSTSLKIPKVDVEYCSTDKTTIIPKKQETYKPIPLVGLHTNLSKRKPDFEESKKIIQEDAGLNDIDDDGDPLKTEITQKEIQVAKKKLVPSVIKTKKPTKPIEI